MKHPFFGSLTFPRWRPDGVAFLEAVSRTYTDPERIRDLYEQAEGDVRLLRTDLTPLALWRKVLLILTQQGKLKTLCEILLATPEQHAIGAATRAIIDAGEEKPVAAGSTILEESDENTQRQFLRYLVGRAVSDGGLTVLLSPYAGFDVDGVGHPRTLARSLLERSLKELRDESGAVGDDSTLDLDFSSGLLSNLLVATASGRAMTTGYDVLWTRMCEIVSAEGGRSRIYPILADLAHSWQIAQGERSSDLNWRGLLIVSFDPNDFLERELEELGIGFGVLNMLSGSGFRYHVNNGRDLGKLKFTQDWPRSDGTGQPLDGAGGAARTEAAGFLPAQSVVVVKLMGLAQMPELRPLLGFETLARPQESGSLPVTLRRHIENKPLLMVGGGLFDPLVALGVEAHFRETGETRWMVCHPSTSDDDVLRIAEYEINRVAPEWTEDVFKMKLLVEDLPTAIGSISSRIIDSARPGG